MAISRAPPAGWQSGYAEDCKSSYASSILAPASIIPPPATSDREHAADAGVAPGAQPKICLCHRRRFRHPREGGDPESRVPALVVLDSRLRANDDNYLG